MQVTSSWQVEIRQQNICIRKTLAVYRDAIAWLIPVYDSVWEELRLVRGKLKRFNYAEHLVHSTKQNEARFDFDRHFYKMPSYLRRAAIQHALGTVSAYRTRLELWEECRREEP
jgi:hypothetical protein